MTFLCPLFQGLKCRGENPYFRVWACVFSAVLKCVPVFIFLQETSFSQKDYFRDALLEISVLQVGRLLTSDISVCPEVRLSSSQAVQWECLDFKPLNSPCVPSNSPVCYGYCLHLDYKLLCPPHFLSVADICPSPLSPDGFLEFSASRVELCFMVPIFRHILSLLGC